MLPIIYVLGSLPLHRGKWPAYLHTGRQWSKCCRNYTQLTNDNSVQYFASADVKHSQTSSTLAYIFYHWDIQKKLQSLVDCLLMSLYMA